MQSMLVHTEDLGAMEHFGKTANNIPKKQLRNLLRENMNCELDKYPHTNTVKVLHVFFQSKTF